MVRILALVATLVVGALIAFQPPVNNELSKYTGVVGAAFVSTAISALVLGVLLVASGNADTLARVHRVPPQYLTGGLMGAALVTVSLVAVRHLGAGGVVAATVLGQLLVSALLDQAGVLGLARHGFGAQRVIGVVLLMGGTALMTLR